MLANVYSYELQSTGVSSRGTQDVLDGQSTGVSSQGPTQDVLVLLEINLFICGENQRPKKVSDTYFASQSSQLTFGSHAGAMTHKGPAQKGRKWR